MRKVTKSKRERHDQNLIHTSKKTISDHSKSYPPQVLSQDSRKHSTQVEKKKQESVSRWPKEAFQLLRKCLALDPNKRITASEALRHPFFEL